MDPYPVTIFKTRYQGVYEGGEWAAVHRDYIPHGAVDDDVTCGEWWGRPHHYAVAVGRTPNAAYNNLIEKINGKS